MMRVRSQTAEHPFGTLKNWTGATHFQMRTLQHVRTEMSLHVLAYNLNIIGLKALMKAVHAFILFILVRIGLFRLPQRVPGSYWPRKFIVT
jgi:hypothetical protein